MKARIISIVGAMIVATAAVPAHHAAASTHAAHRPLHRPGAMRAELSGDTTTRSSFVSPAQAWRAGLAPDEATAAMLSPSWRQADAGAPAEGARPDDEFLAPLVMDADLDGDGIGDPVLAVCRVTGMYILGATSECYGVEALDGRDGSLRWRYAFSPKSSWVTVLRHASGDDLLLLDYDSVRDVTVARWTWRLASIDGADGSAMWSQAYRGDNRGAMGANATVIAEPAGDLDGDGRTDVVVNRWDRVGEIWNGVTTTHAEVLSGSDGASVYRRGDGARAGTARLLPIGQATGGATADLVWETSTSFAEPCSKARCDIELAITDIELIDGDALAPVWQRRLPVDAYLSIDPRHGDLDGDGRADMIARSASWKRFVALRGSDGAPLWDHALDEAPWDDRIVDHIDGTGAGADLVRVRATGDDGADIRLERIDGATGELVFSTMRTTGLGVYAWAWSTPFGDADADGVTDLMIDVWDLLIGSVTFVESSASGVLLHHARNAQVAPAGDLDGEPGDDVVVSTVSGEIATTRVLSLPSGAERWRRSSPIGNTLLQASASRDISGDGAPDVVIAGAQITNEDPPVVTERVDALGGRSGAPLWSIGDEPAPRPQGGLGGVVRVPASDPVGYACVYAIDATSTAVGGVETYDGDAWAIRGLPAGTYRVRVDDCGYGGFPPVWFGGDDEASATPIVVDERLVTGIDVTVRAYDAPANDHPQTAEPLPSETTRTMRGATYSEVGYRTCGFPSADVWFRYTATQTGDLTVDTSGTDSRVYLSAHLDRGPQGAAIACANGYEIEPAVITFPVVAGRTYVVNVGTGAYRGTLHLTSTLD